ncbi:MAG TPA: DUF6531 domain-containing protein [Solirubrobacteraceae bacterium]|jgi:RHS repeat-associated protein
MLGERSGGLLAGSTRARQGWVVLVAWASTCVTVAFLALALGAPSAAGETLCTDTWVGPSKGTWQTASDWSSGSVPTSSGVACIGAGKVVEATSGTKSVGVVQGEGTLAIANAATLELTSGLEVSTINALSLSNGTLTGVGTLVITGSLSWEGTMSGSGSTILSPGASGVQKATARLSERQFVNEGEYSLIGEAHLQEQAGATFTNVGTFLANSSSSDLKNGEVGASPTFVNAGIFKKTSGAETWLYVPFINKGSVEVESGSLTLEGGGSSDAAASWTVDETGFIKFITHGFSFDGGRFHGELNAGSMQSGNVLSVEGLAAAPSTINISEGSATLTVPKGTLTVPQLTLNTGTLTGAGTVVVTSAMSGGAGKMSGSGSTVLRPAVSYAQNWTTMRLSERTLVSEGEYSLINEAELQEQEGAKFENKGTFLVNSQIVTDVENREIGAEPTFVNNGIVKKTGGFISAGIQPLFYNYGRISASYGKIDIDHPFEPAGRTRYGASNHSMKKARRATCGDPVECLTGNLYESQADIAVGGSGVGLELTRSYNAQAAAAGEHGSFGYGWSSSFSDHLVANPGEHSITVVQANGSTVSFIEEDGSLRPPAWSQDKLTGDSEEGYVLTLANQIVYRFAGSGRLESVTERNGNATSLVYNGAGELAAITGSAGRTITLGYNAEKLVTSATGPMGHVVKYGYESGKLASVTMPGESSPRWRFIYDSSHRMTSMINGLGGETTNTYNSASQVTSQKDPAGNVLKWEYEAFNTKITDEATGSVTVDEYDSNDDLTAVTHGYGTGEESTQSLTYDEAGDTLSETDGDGNTTTYEYNAASDKIKEIDPEGHETSWTYNAEHDVTSETLPSGETTSTEYDAHGNPIKISRPGPGETTQTTRYEYDSDGDLISMTDPLGHEWHYGYDEAGEQTSETDPEGDETTWGYDEDGLLTSEVKPRGNVEGAEPSAYTTTIERDERGRPVKITGPEGEEAGYEYDAEGDVTAATDADEHTTRTTYNTEGKPVKETLPGGASSETEYNALGEVVAQINADKEATHYVHNLLGLVSEVVEPLERTTTKTYDVDGALHTITTPEGQTATYAYDRDGQLESVSYSEGGTHEVNYAYNPNGQVTSRVDGTGTSSYHYDQLGRLTETVDGHGGKVTYAYNLANEVTQVTYPNGKSVEDAYDDAGRMTSVTDWLGHTSAFAYDPDGEQASTGFPEASGEEDAYAYDRAGQLTAIHMLEHGEPLATLAYERGLDGNVSKTTQTGLPGPETTEYGYTEDDQLKSAGATEYEYDPAGNPTKLGSTSGTFNAAAELTESDGTIYAYNQLGERTNATPTEGPATSYTYDQAGNLIAVSRPEEGVTSKIEDAYTYDGEDTLATEAINGKEHQLTWELVTGLSLILSDGTTSYIYGPESQPVEQITGSEGEERAQYLHHDQQGSTRLITNETGEVEGAYTYTSYGATETHTGMATTRLGYDAQYTSPDTGLIYLRARTYDPGTAQFLSGDSLAAVTGEPYDYAGDNPVNAGDPSGLIKLPSWEEVGNAIAGWGDTITFGATNWVREELGINNVNYCSSAYQAGKFAGLAIGAFIPGEDDAELGAVGLDEGELAATPEGRTLSAHYLNETGPVRNIPVSVVDETINHATESTDLGDRTVYYDAKNKVTVVQSNTTGKIMSARKGQP